MRTKIVYVLVSSYEDYYLEQAILSIYSLRQNTPNAYILLLTDNVTEDSLLGYRAQIKELVEEFIVVNRQDGLSAKESASLIKTRVRNLIEGDFLFIDTDTIIYTDLSSIDNCPYDVAAVPDAHLKFKEHFGRKGYENLFTKLNFTHTDNLYYNSGVMFVRDTPIAHELYNRWNLSYTSKMKLCFYDQPHLAYANSELNIISELDGYWNCQVQFGIRYLNKAKIIHYFASNFIKGQQEYPYSFMNKDILKSIKDIGSINISIQEMIKNATEQWSDRIEVVGGHEVILLHSRLLKIVRHIYYNHKAIYNLIEKILYIISRIC